jgi:CDP-glycerol glycerophosphotransferase (TagB/SpsB family)
VRFFSTDHGSIGFVAHPHKPWGCNQEALMIALQSHPHCKQIFIFNFSKTKSDIIQNGAYSDRVKVKVFDKTDLISLWTFLIKCKFFVVADTSNYNLPGCIINVWHGVAMKNIGVFQDKRNHKFKRKFDYVVSLNSKLDRNNMALAFNKSVDNILDIGLPRHDWLMGSIQKPSGYTKSINQLKADLKKKKLMLYAPTFRDEDKNQLPISENELIKWAKLLEKYGWVLGVRAHLISYPEIKVSCSNIFFLSAKDYSYAEAIMECSDILVTDYSGICIDYCLLNRPIYGLDVSGARYSRGFLLDFDALFPGEFFTDLDEFLNEVEYYISVQAMPEISQHTLAKRDVFIGGYKADASSKLANFILNTKS